MLCVTSVTCRMLHLSHTVCVKCHTEYVTNVTQSIANNTTFRNKDAHTKHNTINTRRKDQNLSAFIQFLGEKFPYVLNIPLLCMIFSIKTKVF